MEKFNILSNDSGHTHESDMVQKNQSWQFKLKFDLLNNSNIQNLMVVFILFVFDWKNPFWAIFFGQSEIWDLD